MKEPSKPSLTALFDILAIVCWVTAVFVFETHETAALIIAMFGFIGLGRGDLLRIRYEMEKTLYEQLGTKKCPKCGKDSLEFQTHCTRCRRSSVIDPFKEVKDGKDT